jgi:hypothetical protein
MPLLFAVSIMADGSAPQAVEHPWRERGNPSSPDELQTNGSAFEVIDVQGKG